MQFLKTIKAELSPEQQEQFKNHKSSPFCWLETFDGKKIVIGGRDRLCEWVNNSEKFKNNQAVKRLTMTEPSLLEGVFDCTNSPTH